MTTQSMARTLPYKLTLTRQSFELPDKSLVKWFPGHMKSGLDHMLAALKDVDCVLEMHDARIPFSGRTKRFRDALNLRPHMLLLNKSDLSDLSRKSKIVKNLKSQGVDKVLFTNNRYFRQQRMITEFVPKVLDLVHSRNRHHRAEAPDYNLMILGVPNVGKSTLINALRNTVGRIGGRAVRVGAKAGVTRGVSTKVRISYNPDIFLIDTPGILTPKVESLDVGMRLALCSCLPDYILGPETLSDYLLYWLNKNEKYSYVDKLELNEPTDNILDVLAHTANKHNKYKKFKDRDNQVVFKPDFYSASSLFIRMFREGALGKFMLDSDMLN